MQFLANLLTNIFVFFGVYYLIYAIWIQIEITKFREIRPRKRDTVICLFLSLAITLVLEILR